MFTVFHYAGEVIYDRKVEFNPVVKKVITLLGQVILIFFIMVSCVGGVMVVLGLEYALEKISTSRSVMQMEGMARMKKSMLE